MNLPSIEPILPEDPESLPPARRRRSRRLNFSGSTQDERAEFLAEVAHRVTPSADYFLFSLLSGAVLVAALLTDAPALFLLSVLLAPFLAPVMGLSFGMLLGSPRFFFQSLTAVLIGGLILFGMGALAGWVSQFLPAAGSTQAALHAAFTWPDILLLVIGAGLTTFMLARSPDTKPLVSNIALAYALYLPAGVAGYGLVSGTAGLWPDGVILFGVYLALAVLASAIVLAAFRLRPLNAFGYTATGGLILVCVLAGLAVLGAMPGVGVPPAAPLVINPPPVDATLTVTNAPPMTTETPAPPTATLTPTNSLVPSMTPTLTLTPVPTPLWAKVYAPQSNGVLVRLEPNGTSKIVASLLNNNLVEVLPEVVQDGAVTWVHVRVNATTVGWINQSLLITATPAPGW